jgi:hypothetical protein
MYHNMHAANIDSSACHIQSVVTSNNCHIGNYQSVEYQGNTVVALGRTMPTP